MSIKKHKTESQIQEPEVTGSKVTWWKRDRDGQRVTTRKRRKKGSSAGLCQSHKMNRLEDLLEQSVDGQDFAKQSPLSSWYQRQKDVQQARPQNLANLLQTTMHGFYRYIPPTEFVKLHDDKHIICEQGWYLSFFPLILHFFALTN
ncbi:Microtubule-actin cross-linking factor 1 [Labeo rohita]|uniref:Microtubule-actin cross-linking factor 1 n=1 Tax=Labeo rohita TaxID=84645 RepID=A0ABQ8MT80_LABRO|nr:Microtubule-actin cross-linking factor 1 [Labeo rohita]